MPEESRFNSLGCIFGVIAIILVLIILFVGPLVPLFMPGWFQR